MSDSRGPSTAERLHVSDEVVESAPLMAERAAETRLSLSGPWGIEVEILLACARAHLDERDISRVRALVAGGPDWERLLLLATFHRLLPLVYWNLNAAAPEVVPEKWLNLLKAWFLQNAASVLEWSANLLEILQLFEEAGILAVPYKGPVLASHVYGNLALRLRGDLDILVERRDVSRARQLLEQAGFRPPHPASKESREFLFRHRYSEIFVRQGSSAVELHWAFTSSAMAFPLELRELRPRLREGSLGGSRVPTFADEDLLLILCVHGAKHCWDRLEWLSGAAELARKDGIAWAEVMNRAKALSSEKTLLLGLFLANDLLDAPIPGSILEEARSSRDVMRLAALVRQGLAADVSTLMEPPNSLPRDLFRVRLQPTLRRRLGYLFGRLTVPGRDDTRLMLPLGRHYIPLPALVRPFRVLGKLVVDFVKRPEPRRSSKKV